MPRSTRDDSLEPSGGGAAAAEDDRDDANECHPRSSRVLFWPTPPNDDADHRRRSCSAAGACDAAAGCVVGWEDVKDWNDGGGAASASAPKMTGKKRRRRKEKRVWTTIVACVVPFRRSIRASSMGSTSEMTARGGAERAPKDGRDNDRTDRRVECREIERALKVLSSRYPCHQKTRRNRDSFASSSSVADAEARRRRGDALVATCGCCASCACYGTLRIMGMWDSGGGGALCGGNGSFDHSNLDGNNSEGNDMHAPFPKLAVTVMGPWWLEPEDDDRGTTRGI